MRSVTVFACASDTAVSYLEMEESGHTASQAVHVLYGLDLVLFILANDL
jgi:hypothetical protein